MEEREERERDAESGDGEAGDGASDSSPATDKLPSLPADDDAPLGDTDQHSDA